MSEKGKVFVGPKTKAVETIPFLLTKGRAYNKEEINKLVATKVKEANTNHVRAALTHLQEQGSIKLTEDGKGIKLYTLLDVKEARRY